jgi:hypothetical protein
MQNHTLTTESHSAGETLRVALDQVTALSKEIKKLKPAAKNAADRAAE